MRLFRKGRAGTPARLHIGCGQQAIEGWINIDNQRLPGVDRVLDIRRGLPYADVAAIYAEHFLEHLAFEDALAFLEECRRALRPDGVLRVSTPNVEWVLATHYRWQDVTAENRLTDCVRLNRAFHGWGHRFLYNRETLESAVRAAGFARATGFRYGESDEPALRGLERHETWEDSPELPHVLVVEASGIARPKPLPNALMQEFREALDSK